MPKDRVSEATFYSWKKYAGLGVTELRELRQLREENGKLKRLVADLSLDKHILQEIVAHGQHDVEMRPRENYLSLRGYRLPTEAEWEFGCRAGAETRRYFGHGDELLRHYAWFTENTAGHTMPVGLLKPNDLGLFDMHGGVWNWCNNRFAEYGPIEEDVEDLEPARTEVRMMRAGAYVNVQSHVRAACRNNLNQPGHRFHPLGFRVARTIPGAFKGAKDRGQAEEK